MNQSTEKRLDVVILLLGVLAADVARQRVEDGTVGGEKLLFVTDQALRAFDELLAEPTQGPEFA